MVTRVRDTFNSPTSATTVTIRNTDNHRDPANRVFRTQDIVEFPNKLIEMEQHGGSLLGIHLNNLLLAAKGDKLVDGYERHLPEPDSITGGTLAAGYQAALARNLLLLDAVPNFTNHPVAQVNNLSVWPELGFRAVFGGPETRNVRVHAPEPRIRHQQTYEARVRTLREFIEEEIESVNEESVKDFWRFMKDNRFTRRAGLVMLKSGDLRAVWQERDGHHIGLRFLGNRQILYVMIRAGSDRQETVRVADTGDFDEVNRQLRELDLFSFVNG